MKKTFKDLLFHPALGFSLLIVAVFTSTLFISVEVDDSLLPAPGETPGGSFTALPVVVALQPISRYTTIPPGAIGVRPWPDYMARFPPGWLVDDEAEAVGQMVNIDIAPGQPIVRRMFTSPRDWGLAVQPAAGQNAIFYSYKQHLYALDAGNGQEVWHFEVKDKFAAVSSPPVVAEELVYYVVASLDYFQDPQSQLYALEAATGRERWHFTETDTKVKRRMPPLPPLIVEDVIYFVTWGGGRLYALNAQTGQEKWRFATNGFLSYPAVNGKLITFVSSDGYLYNLDLTSGVEQWRARWPWP